MELEELKEAWTALDNRLKRNEELKESIILEMMQSKADKSLNKILGWNVFNGLGLLLVIPFLVFVFNRFGGKVLFWDIFIIYCVLVCSISFFWNLYKIRGLMKINITTDVTNSIHLVNRYHIWAKRERFITQFIIGNIFLIIMILMFIEVKANFQQWVMLVCVVAFVTLYEYWEWKKLYKKHIESILKSLDEIRELKEE